MLRAAFAVVLAAVAAGQSPSAPSPSPTAAELKQKLERQLEDLAAHVDGVVGYSLVDLESGERISHLGNAVFPTASSIKIAIVYELVKQVDEGRVRLDEAITLDRSKAVGGSGVLFELGTPTLSLGDYATRMVVLSDNTATNVVIDRLGLERVAARMQSLGLKDTKLRRRMMDVAAARRGDENVSTPDELVNLLQIVNRGEGLTPGGRDAALALLKKSKTSRLRRGLPPGVDAADKPGELEGVRVDAGIVFAKNRPYAISVMTTFLRSETDGEAAIERMSRTAYEYFARLGAGGALGRQLGR